MGLPRVAISSSAMVMLVVLGIHGCGPSGNERIEKASADRLAREKELRETASSHREAARGMENMILIPAGKAMLGDRTITDLRPRTVDLPAFYIGKFEVTNGEYEKFVIAENAIPPYYWEGGHCPEDRRDYPVTVCYLDAVRYAEWAGKRLPSSAEWEKAARGENGLRYPWGQEYDPAACNGVDSGVDDTVPVGAYPNGQSPYGCLNMTGNVQEWTTSDAPDGKKVLKGGCYKQEARFLMPAFEGWGRVEVEKNPTTGFRLAKDAD